jgi:hypothetical protein
MSVASLNNGSLQLSELVISNEKYSNATGYVASSSTFSAGLTGTSLSVSGDIVLPSGDIIVENGGLTVSGDISCNAITATSEVVTPTVGLYSGTQATFINLACSTGNTLAIGNGSGANASNGTLDVGSINASGTITSEVGGSISSTIYGLYNSTTTTDFVNLSCPNSNILAIGNGSGANASNGTLDVSSIEFSGSLSGSTTASITVPELAFYVNTTTDFVNLTGSGNQLSIGNSSGTVGASNGTVRCASIILSANGQTGTLSVNSTGGLTWNGTLIS